MGLSESRYVTEIAKLWMTNVGDEICWWQVWNWSSASLSKFCHQFSKSVTKFPSATSWCHQQHCWRKIKFFYYQGWGHYLRPHPLFQWLYFYIKLVQMKKYPIHIFCCWQRILQNFFPNFWKFSQSWPLIAKLFIEFWHILFQTLHMWFQP